MGLCLVKVMKIDKAIKSKDSIEFSRLKITDIEYMVFLIRGIILTGSLFLNLMSAVNLHHSMMCFGMKKL